MSKKLAIYFSDPEPMGYPFNTHYPYWGIYQGIIKDVEKYGIEVYIVRGNSYLGKGIFSHGWQVRDGGVVAVDQPIMVDLIFNRDDKNTIPAIYDCLIINHPDLDRICVDKVETAELFPDLSPKTKAINSYKEFLQTVSEWSLNTEDKIVLKKNFLTEGRGVYILPVKDLTESLYENWKNILVQEFIDSSIGIPDIIEGVHDIRVTTINGEPVYAYVRVPPPGSFIANVARGGTMIPVAIDKLPANLLELIEKINNKFIQYRPNIFASDFFNSKNGFKLIEMNSRPAVLDPTAALEHKVYDDKIVQMLVSTLT